jgi:hypothetical protein
MIDSFVAARPIECASRARAPTTEALSVSLDDAIVPQSMDIPLEGYERGNDGKTFNLWEP